MSERSSSPRSSATSVAGAPPFVGRLRELAALEAALAQARDGHGQMVLLAGEAGIGKTRLVEELVARARGAAVCWGRCWEGEGAPAFWPWVQVVRQYMRAYAPDEVLTDLGLAVADVARVVPEIAALSGAAPSGERAAASGREQERFRFFDGLTGFLRAAARRRPLVLALDDLQWADTPSLLLLQFLAREFADIGLLVVATYRPGGLAPDHPLSTTLAALSRERACQQLAMAGLARAEIARFVELLARRRPPSRIVAALDERTEGNPLFLHEAVTLLSRSGQLAGDLPTLQSGRSPSRRRCSRPSHSAPRRCRPRAAACSTWRLSAAASSISSCSLGEGRPLLMIAGATRSSRLSRPAW